MKKIFRILFAVFLIPVTYANAVEQGTWRKLFNGKDPAEILEVFGGGNHLWFSTLKSVGRVNVLTGKCEFFYFDTLNMGGTPFLKAAYDSTFALFYGSNGTGGYYRFDGTATKIDSSAPYCLNAFINHDRSFWSANDYSIVLWNRNTAPVRSFRIPEKVPAVQSLAEDSSGTVWFSTFKNLYRSVGDALVTVSYPCPLLERACVRGKNGEVFILTVKGVYTAVDDVLTPVMPLDTMIDANIDRYNNLWCFGIVDDGDTLSTFSRVSLETKKVTDYGRYSGPGEIIPCDNGVALFHWSGFKYYPVDCDTFAWHSVREELAPGCGNLKYSEPFIWNARNCIITESRGGSLLLLKDGRCEELPYLDFSPRPVYELNDGRVLATTTAGLYTFDGSRWEPFDVGRNIIFYSLVQMPDGTFWGYGPGGVMHGNGTEWVTIDRKNVTMPVFSFNTMILDSGGTVWFCSPVGFGTSDCIAGTRDGSSWTVFDTATTPFIRKMNCAPQIDPGGSLSVWVCRGDDDFRSCRGAEKWRYHDNRWSVVDTIDFPTDTFFMAYIYEDRHGNIWVRNFDVKTLLRYTADTVISYPIDGHVTRESADGTLYAYTSDGYFRFDRNPSGRSGNPVVAQRRGNPFAIRIDARGNLIIDCAPARSGHVSIELYSLRGELLKTLLNRYRPRGRLHICFPLNNASGGIIMRLRTPDGTDIRRFPAFSVR